jgi:hypothetical protein
MKKFPKSSLILLLFCSGFNVIWLSTGEREWWVSLFIVINFIIMAMMIDDISDWFKDKDG